MLKKSLFCLLMAGALIGCHGEETDVPECNQLFEYADRYVDSLPAAAQANFKAQFETLKKQIDQNKPQAKALCESAMADLNVKSQ